jgi:hypothetical protein
MMFLVVVVIVTLIFAGSTWLAWYMAPLGDPFVDRSHSCCCGHLEAGPGDDFGPR